MLEGNQRFHFAVYHAADAGELLKIIETLWLRSGPIVASERNVPGSVAMFSRGVQIHERVTSAIERRDAAAARFALALDIRAAAAWFRHNYRFDAPAGKAVRGRSDRTGPSSRRALATARMPVAFPRTLVAVWKIYDL